MHILRWCNIRIRNISNHLQNSGSCLCFLISNDFVDFFLSLSCIIIDILISPNSATCEHLFGRFWRVLSKLKTRRIIIRIMQDHRVGYANVLIRSARSISDGVINFRQNVLPFDHFTKNTVLTIQIVQLISKGKEELASQHVLPTVHHAHEPLLGVLDPRHCLCFKEPSLWTVQLTENAVSSTASASRVACLRDEVCLDGVE